jgi:rhodanese-related sulfurtransferase
MKKTSRTIITAAVVAIVVIGYIVAQSSSVKTISVAETKTKIEKDTAVFVLDVRTPQEHNGERIAETVFIPVQELEQRIHELDQYKNRPMIVYCRSGHRSGIATEILVKNGFNAVSMAGGINQWKAEGYSTIQGTK